MTVDRTAEYLRGLLREFCALPKETEWVEFKENMADPQEIGEYISALSNSAALCGKSAAYLVWGVSNNSHDIVGTSFKPHTARKGSEELESWLLRLLSPRRRNKRGQARFMRTAPERQVCDNVSDSLCDTP